MNPLKQLFSEKNLLILTHQHGDIDAIGTAIVLAESLSGVVKSATIVSPSSVSKAANQLAKTLGYEVFTEADLTRFDATAMVDTSVPDHIALFDAAKLPTPLAVIDHHAPSDFPGATIKIVAQLPSCVEVLLPHIGELTRKARVAALAAILADTRQFNQATRSTFEAVISLMKDDEYVQALNSLRGGQDISEKIAVLKALQNLKLEKHKGYLLAYCKAGSFEATVANQLIRLGADVAIVVTEKDEGCRITGRLARSLEGRLDLAKEVFEPIGRQLNGSGGGHSAASSANLKSEPEKALSATVKVINRLLTASFRDSDDGNVD